MHIPINIEFPELESFMDVAPVPQTHVDLASIEYRKAKVGKEHWATVMASFWLGLESYTLKNSRN